MSEPQSVFALGGTDPVPPEEWNTSRAGELIMATHKNINPDTRSELYDFIRKYHISDPNLCMLKGAGDNLFSFTHEAECFLKSALDETPHRAVKAALLYDLIRGYFTVSQSIRYVELRGGDLREKGDALEVNSSIADSPHFANIRYWSNFAADEIEMEVRRYAKLAKEEFKKERLYECNFDNEGNLFRRLITTLGRRVDILLYQMNYFGIGKPVKNEVFTTLEGETVNLRDRAGRVALVDVWSTTCSPCRRKLPDLMELQKKLGGKSFEIIALNVDKDRDTLDAFLEKPKFVYLADDEERAKVDDYLLPYIDAPELTLPVVHMGLSRLLKLWDISGYPTLFLLDRDGVMHARGHDVPYDSIDTLMGGSWPDQRKGRRANS